jgi:hypothetical protein
MRFTHAREVIQKAMQNSMTSPGMKPSIYRATSSKKMGVNAKNSNTGNTADAHNAQVANDAECGLVLNAIHGLSKIHRYWAWFCYGVESQSKPREQTELCLHLNSQYIDAHGGEYVHSPRKRFVIDRMFLVALMDYRKHCRNNTALSIEQICESLGVHVYLGKKASGEPITERVIALHSSHWHREWESHYKAILGLVQQLDYEVLDPVWDVIIKQRGIKDDQEED